MAKHAAPKGGPQATTNKDKPKDSPQNSIPFNRGASPEQKARDFDQQIRDHGGKA